MKYARYITLFLFSFSVIGMSLSQETHAFERDYLFINKAHELFNHEEYGICATLIENQIDLPHHLSKSEEMQAIILLARAKLKMRLDNSDTELVSILKSYKPNNYTNLSYTDLANHYFQNQEYVNALDYFALVNLPELDDLAVAEISFKKGYSHFVKKEFYSAKMSLKHSLEERNKYFYPRNYYYGMCSYFENDFDGALKSFRRVESSDQYKNHIPYYICQIHFAKQEYDQLISYAESRITKRSLKNLNRIRLLLGQSYYKKGNYSKALEHLEYYESTTSKLTAEEFYQLAFTQYQNKSYEKAKGNFSAISLEKNEMGQLANYYLSDCHLKTGDKKSARTAFKNVAGMSYNVSMKEEANFNYGKLSVEEGFDSEAINVLTKIPKGSKYYFEAQGILSTLFLRTKDFDRSIAALEKIGNKSPELKAAYQIVTLSSGLQAINDQQYNTALTQLNKSLKSPADRNLKAQALFWKAMVFQNQQKYSASSKEFENYFNSNPNDPLLPADCKSYKAYYYQAYNYLKQENFQQAFSQFDASIKTKTSPQDPALLLDATIRAADCLFSINKNKKAKHYYERVLEKRTKHSDYATYQIALIEGLSGNTYEKIILLEELIEKYPQSDYVDNAYMHIGDCYVQLNNDAEAFEAYESLILNYQDKSTLINEALLKLGLSSYNQGDITTALKYYKKVMANNPTAKESNEALVAIEEIYIQDLGQSKEYLTYLDNLPNYDLNDRSKDSLSYKIAEVQFENTEYSKAIKSFKEYLNDFKEGLYVLNAHFYKAEAHTVQKEYSLALPGYEEVISRGVNEYYEIALKKSAIICLNDTRDYDKAYTYNLNLLEFTQDPQTKNEARVNAMQSAFKANRLMDASELARFIFNDQTTSADDKVAASFVLGKNALAIQNSSEAISALNYVIQNNNGVLAAESSYLLSELYYSNGKLKEAEQQCKATNTVSSNYPFWIAKSLLLLSDIYMAHDDLFNARAATEAVLENFKEDPEIIESANIKLEQIVIREQVKNRVLEGENEKGLLELDHGN